MKLGRLHLHGAQAWPDHVLDAQLGGPIFGIAIAVRRWAIGFEIAKSAFSRATWLNVYLGLWAFEIYVDVAGEYEEASR
jgi:hypothetical protein